MGFRGVRPSSDFEQIISEISVEPCSYYSGTEQTGTGPWWPRFREDFEINDVIFAVTKKKLIAGDVKTPTTFSIVVRNAYIL